MAKKRFKELKRSLDLEHAARMSAYLSGNVASLRVPVGKVVVHNHIKPANRLGVRGFRAWLSEPQEKSITRCDCGWAPHLGQHFRVRRIEL